MTLPFRRRHHDDETAHDRARALTAHEMLEPLPDDAAGWLAGHLEGCAECRRDREGYLADRDLLRAVRERTPEPPRDLWARTSAALDREAGHRGRRVAAPSRGWRGLPFGAAAGALIVAVVIGVSNFPRPVPPNATPGGSQVAVVTAEPQPTPFGIDAGRVAWVELAEDGAAVLRISNVDEVCPRSRPACQELGGDGPGTPLNLGSTPTGVTFSPGQDQLVVESRGEGTSPDRIFVVAVPVAGPTATPTPSGTPTEAPTDTAGPIVTADPTTPSSEPPGSPEPTPMTPDGSVEIASGVVVVGETAYSDDGTWLAFSARPSDGSTGPDLYLWKVGDPVAVPVTTDHQTYFSAWLDGRVLASRVEVATPIPTPSADPLASPTTDPGVPPARDPSEPPSGAPSDAPSAAPEPTEGNPVSFLLDPATLERADIAQAGVWLPVVDPTGRFVVYWSGILVSTADGLDWLLGTGELVLDGWSEGATPDPSTQPSPGPSADPADPASSGAPVQRSAFGPAGNPVPVVEEATASFKAKFDPTGTRLAVWVGEQLDAAVGRLHLLVLDPETGAIDADQNPLPGAPALRKFTIERGRLAWVSPSGQDGQESSVQVLGWLRNQFGEIRTIPARDLLIVR
jgi:hypothetical protein